MRYRRGHYRIFICGGDSDFNFGATESQVDIYDIPSGTWLGTGTPMPTPAVAAGYAQVGSNLYVVGGWDDNYPTNVATTQMYDMATDTWSYGPVFTPAKGDFPLTTDGTHLWAVGGDADGGTPFDMSTTTEVLDLSAWPGGSWEQLPNDMPTGTQAMGAFYTISLFGGEIWKTAGALPGPSQTQETLYRRVAPLPYDVTVAPLFALYYGNASDVVDVVVDINNDGMNDDTYNLTGAGAWPFTIHNIVDVGTITNVSVPAGTTVQVVLRVSIPGGTNPGEFEYFTLTAASQNDTLLPAAVSTARVETFWTGYIDVLMVTPDLVSGGDLSGIFNNMGQFIDTNLWLWDGTSGTPTVEDMLMYDMVLVGGQYTWAGSMINKAELSNNLAKYIDKGGKVLASNFVWFISDSWNLAGGRFIDGDYSPFTLSSGPIFSTTALGTFNTTHPIMKGITNVQENFVLHDGMGLGANGTNVAAWLDGSPCVATSTRCVGMNAQLLDSASLGAQGWELVYNSILYLVKLPALNHSVIIVPQTQTNGGVSPETVDYAVMIQNLGTENDTFNLSVTSGWTAVIRDGADTTDITSVSVPAGSTAVIIVRVAVPGGQAGGTRDYAYIRAASQNDTTNDTAEVVTFVAYTAPWFDGFEAGFGDWTTHGTSYPGFMTNWEYGDPAGTPIYSYDGSSCAATNIADVYYPDADIVLESPYLYSSSQIPVLVVSPDYTQADMSLLFTTLSAFPDLAVTPWDPADGDPTAADMAPYPVVIVGNDYLWNNMDKTNVGNALADYIDAWGKVIESQYVQSYDAWGFGGRYMTGGYSPFTPASLDNWNPDSMVVVDPTHPVMAGVTTLNDNFGQQNPGLAAGATLLATWGGTGYNAIACNDNVVAIDMLICAAAAWSGDLGTLLHNSIQWLSGGGSGGSQTLSFFQWYGMDSAGEDGGFVEIELGNSGTWTQIFPYGGYPVTGGYIGGYAVDAYSGNTGGVWEYEMFDLSPYMDQIFRIRFHFASNDMNYYAEWGWYLDDVYIGQNPFDVAATPELQVGFGDAGTTVNYTVTVDNPGAAAETFDLSVASSIWPVSFFDTGMNPIISVGPVASGGTAQFIAQVTIPGGAMAGDTDTAILSVISQHDPANVSDDVSLITQVTAQFLFVNDGGLANGPWFYQAFADNGHTFNTWDTSTMGVPPAAMMALFNAVVWTTGNRNGGGIDGSPLDTLSVIEQLEIGMFLDGGGRMYLSGAGAGIDAVVNGWGGWMSTYFGGAVWGGNTADPYTMTGVFHDPIGDGLALAAYQGDSDPEMYGLFSVMDPAAPNDVPWITEDFSGGNYYTAMRHTTTVYRSVFTGWDLADVDGAADRALTLEKILEWLLAPDMVEFRPSYQEYADEANTTIIFRMMLTNMGWAYDSYDLNLLPGTAWATEIRDETATTVINTTGVVAPMASFNFTVLVTIPVTALEGDYDWATINASSQSRPEIYDWAWINTLCYVTPPSTDDFEGGYADFRAFSVGTGTTQWEIGDPTSFGDGPGGAHSATDSWGTNLLDYYYPQADCRLNSHYYNLTAAGGANLTFYHWYNTAGWDGGFVEITTDYGVTWTRITPSGGYPGFNWYGFDCYSGSSAGWEQAWFDLTPYLGNVISFRLRFMSAPGAPANLAGWYVDDFTVNAFYPARGCLLIPTEEMGMEIAGNDVSYLLTVRNVGTAGPDWFDLSSTSLNGWTVTFTDMAANVITDVGPLNTGDSVDIWATVSIPGGANPGDFEFTNVSATSQNDTGASDTSTLFTQTYGDILLVDDDLGIDSQSWYTDGLAAMAAGGFMTYNTWDVYRYGAPGLADLLPYRAVIWATGNSYGTNGESLSAADRLALEQYMTAGGNVYLTGDMFWMDAWNNGWTSWLANWFGAVPSDGSTAGMGTGWDMFDTTPQTLNGVPGDPIGRMFGSLPLRGPGSCPSIWGSYAVLDPVGPGAAVSFDFAPGLADGQAAVVRMDGGTFRTVVAGFDHSQIGNPSDRWMSLGMILAWLVTRPPVSSNALVDGMPVIRVPSGTIVTLIATTQSTPPLTWHSIAGANFTDGAGSWPGVAMDAQDGSFDGPIEDVTATIDTTGWAQGQHDLYVYCYDNIPNNEVNSTAYATIIIDDNAPRSYVAQEPPYWRSANPDTIHAFAVDSGLVNEDFDGGAWPPTDWSTGGICAASQNGAPALTHYWSLFDDATMTPLLGTGLSRTAPDAAGLWWSDGTGGDPVDRTQNEWLTTPPMDFSSYTTVELRFWSIYTMMRYGAGANSHNYIMVSTNGGSTWTTLGDMAHDAAFDFNGCSGGLGGAGWNWYEVPISVDLSAYAGEPMVTIAWNYNIALPLGSRGIWTIDDVSIVADGVPADPITVSGVDSVALYYRFSANNITWGAWTLFNTVSGTPYDFSFSWPDGEGYYQFYTIATDFAGNVESVPFVPDAVYAYEISIPTSQAIQTPPYFVEGKSKVIDATASNGLSGVRDVELWYRTSTDNATWGAWTLYGTDAAMPWQWTFTAGTDGYYEFYTRAHDFAGNYEDAPATADAAWLFDLIGPSSNVIPTTPYIVNTNPFTIDVTSGFSGTLINEQFEGAWPPAGWSVINYGGNGVWQRNDMWSTARPNYAGGSGFCADADSDRLGSGTTMDTGLQTPPLDLSGASSATLTFTMSYNDIATGGDFAQVRVSTDGGTTWTNLAAWDADVSATGPGTVETFNLANFTGYSNVIVEFHYFLATWDWWFEVDNVQVSIASDPLSSVKLWHRYSFDNVTWGSWMNMYTDGAAPWQFSWLWPDGGGYYEFFSTAVDDWGWEESWPATADARYYYDIFGPTVISTSPPDGAPAVAPVGGTFAIHFSEMMDTGSGTAATNLPGIAWTWSADGRWLNGTYGGLAYTTGYYVDLTGGGYTDWVGNALSGADLNFTFTTAGPDWAAATGPSSAGSTDPQPAITYNYGGTLTQVDIYYSNDGGSSWTLWGSDATVDYTWAPSINLPSDGTYYWNARARGALFNETAPTNAADIEAGPYVFDTTGPSSSVDPVTPYWHNAPITLTATASDATSGVAWVEFFYAYSADNVTWSAAISIGSDFTAPYTMAFNWPDGDGDYLFYSVAVDRAGNLEGMPGTADAAAAYDYTGPMANVNPLGAYWYATSPLNLDGWASDALNPVDHVDLVYWFSPDNVTWGGPTVFGTDSAAPWNWAFTYPNGTGFYRFAARAFDTLGNAPAWPPAMYDVEVGYDNLLPSSYAIQSAPYMQTAITLTVDANAIDSGPSGLNFVNLYYRFSPDNGTTPWTSWTLFQTDYAAPWQWTFTWPMGVGYYQLYTRSMDFAGNAEAAPPVADAAYWWNPPAPISSVVQKASYWQSAGFTTFDGTVIVTGNPVAYDELWYRYSADNATWGAWTYFANDTDGAPYSWDFSWPAGNGYYEFYSRAGDTLGNYEPAPVTCDALNGYDNVAPSSSVTFEAPFWRTTTPLYPNATVGADLSGVNWVEFNFRYSTDNVTWGAWGYFAMDMVAPYQATFNWPSGEGYYQFASQAFDFAGNAEAMHVTGDATYCYDTTAPTSSVNAMAPYWKNSSPTLAVATVSDATSGIYSLQLYYYYSADNSTWGGPYLYGTQYGAPWQISFAFTTYGEGYYRFYTIATDMAGNAESAPASPDASCGYDATNPTCSVTWAGPYWRNTSPLTVNVAATDALSGMNAVYFTYQFSTDNVTWGSWQAMNWDYTAPYSDTLAWPNGPGYYRISPVAYDRAGNTQSAAYAYWAYDSVAPTSSVNAITPYYRTTGPINIDATASDATSGVNTTDLYYRYSSDNATWGGWTYFGSDTTAPYQYSFSFSNGTGFYEFRSIAIDVAGNTESAPATADARCCFDDVAPTSSGVTVGPYATYSANRMVNGTASDSTSGIHHVALYYRYSANNATWTPWMDAGMNLTAAPWTWSGVMPNGTGYYEFYTVAVDRAGNVEPALGTADCGLRILADATPPTSNVVTVSPYWRTSSPVIDATASDAQTSVAYVELWWRYSQDNVTWGAWTNFSADLTAPYSWTFNDMTEQGYYQFYSRARDIFGNYEAAPSSADAFAAYDTMGPVVTVTALPAFVTNATISISWTATDLSGLSNATLYYTTDGGTTWVHVTGSSTTAFTFTAPADGTYGFYVQAWDVLGNHGAFPSSTTTIQATTLVDTTRPTVTASTPSGTNVNITTTMTMTFSEPMNKTSVQNALTFSPTMTVTFAWNALNTTLTMTPSSALAYLTWFNVTVGTGAKDAHGLAMSAPQAVTFRTKASPVVPPTTGTIVGRVVDENGDPISGATVTLEGTSLSATTDANGNYTISNVPPGTYTVTATHPDFQPQSVSATATAGTTTTAPVLTMAPSGKGAGDWWWIIIIIVVVMVVVLLLWFLMKRKQKKDEGKTDDVEDTVEELEKPAATEAPKPDEAPKQ